MVLSLANRMTSFIILSLSNFSTLFAHEKVTKFSSVEVRPGTSPGVIIILLMIVIITIQNF